MMLRTVHDSFPFQREAVKFFGNFCDQDDVARAVVCEPDFPIVRLLLSEHRACREAGALSAHEGILHYRRVCASALLGIISVRLQKKGTIRQKERVCLRESETNKKEKRRYKKLPDGME